MINAKIQPDVGLFIISQLDGVIHIKSLEDGTQLSYLNDSNWVNVKNCIDSTIRKSTDKLEFYNDSKNY